MKSAARALTSDLCTIITGKAGKEDQGIFTVVTPAGLIGAQRAAGCILRPEEGDLVLVAQGDSGGAYILSVLERAGNCAAILDVAGDMTVRSSGRTSVGGKDVAVEADEKAWISSPSFSLKTGEGNIEAGTLSLLGKAARVEVERVRTVLGSLDSSVGRVMENIRRRYSRIEEFADERYGRLRCLVRDALSLKGRSVKIDAKERVAIDGERIDIG